MRTITVNGFIGKDAEVKSTATGEFMTLRIVSHEYNGSTDSSEYNSDDYWFEVISSISRHIKLAPYLTKGRTIIVTGKYTDGFYMSSKTRNIEIDRKIRAYDITLVGSRRNGDESVLTALDSSESNINNMSCDENGCNIEQIHEDVKKNNEEIDVIKNDNENKSSSANDDEFMPF